MVSEIKLIGRFGSAEKHQEKTRISYMVGKFQGELPEHPFSHLLVVHVLAILLYIKLKELNSPCSKACLLPE